MKIKFQKTISRLILLLTLLCVKFYVFGQDLHYSQFYNTHVNINPALTGIFNGDIRLATNFRNQWPSVPVPYNTTTAAVDFKINRPCKPGFWGAGLVLNYDKAGDSQLNLATLGFNGSYSIPLKEKSVITFGGQLALSRRAFSLDDLAFDEQWDGSQYIASSAVTDAFDRKSVLIPDVSLGINYRIQKSPLHKWDIGLSLFHINRPQSPFYTDDKSVKLPMRLALNVLSSNRISSGWDLMINGLAQFQGAFREIIIGAGPKFTINQKAGKNHSIGLLLNYRLQDALAPALQIQINDLQVGLSYDINTSPFHVTTGRKGGPELSLLYFINKVKPFDKPQFCPIY
jgi:type IX secretion system PorP/SprF family membrane protein